MSDTDDRQPWQRELSGLQREIRPDRDLWPGIEHALDRRRARRWPPVALAAALVLALGLGAVIGPLLQGQRGVSPEVAALIDRLQTQHQNVKQALLVRYGDREPWTDDWPQRMEQLEQAEQRIYEAYREDPANLELLRILRDVQDRQIELINAVYAPGFNTI